MCEITGCRNWPSYNFPGKMPMYCSEHRTNEMIDTRCTCTYIGCQRVGTYVGKCIEHRIENYKKDKERIKQAILSSSEIYIDDFNIDLELFDDLQSSFIDHKVKMVSDNDLLSRYLAFLQKSRSQAYRQ